MSDEFSIRDNQKKRAQKPGESPAGLDELRADEQGEAAWSLLDEDDSRQDKENRSEAEEAPAFPPMPGFGDDEEEPPTPSSIDIVRLLLGVWSRRNLIIVITAVVTILFGAIAFTMLHHSWTARVVLLAREHADQFQVGDSTAPFKQQKYSIKTMLDTVKLPRVLSETISKSNIQVSPRTLSSLIGVVLGKESKVFQITVKWDDPQMAATVANNLVDSFVELNRGMRRADAQEVYEYYNAQLADVTAKLQKIDDEVLAFKVKNEVVDFDTQTQVILEKLSDLEIDHRVLQAEIEVEEQTILRYEKTFAEIPELIVTTSLYRNPLKKKLSDLEWELEQARGRYTDKNPKVIDLIDQIESMNKLLEKGKDDATPENTYSANPVKQELELKVYKLEDEIRLKKAKLKSLNKSIEVANKSLASIAEKQKLFIRITSEQDSVKVLLDNLRNRVEEAKVIMQNGQGDFDIIARARVPDEPESSGRKLMLIAGFVLGGGLGMFIALLLEFLSPVIKTRKETAAITETKLVFEFQQVPADEQLVIDVKLPGETVAVIFRRILNDLLLKLTEDDTRTLAFVSAERGSGRSLVITNIAQALSLKEFSCLLVDADFVENAGMHPAEYYEVGDGRPGLLDVLDGKSRLSTVALSTESPGVNLIPASSSSSTGKNLETRLGSRRMAALVSKLRAVKGYVLYDLPPLLEYETAIEAAAEIGHAIVVVRSGVSKKSEVRAIVERLRSTGVEIHAVILTDVPRQLMYGKKVYEVKKTGKKLWFWKKT